MRPPDALRAARAQRSALRDTAHRPWPVPGGPWVMGQSWLDLLFHHVPVDADALRPHVPASLALDRFDGAAWISVAAFEIRGTRLRGLPPVPRLSRFPELNVRTYVMHGDRPGIWFFSLDAPGALAVATARRVYRLPYFRAAMAIEHDGPWVSFHSDRVDRRGPRVGFAARYRATDPPRPAAPGSLAAWLVERYRLYAVDPRGRVLSGDIHHEPWSLRPAEAEIAADTTLAGLGVAPAGEPVLHVAGRQDVVFWPPRRAGG